MFLKPVAPEVPVVKCSCCSAPATPGDVWGHAVCDACFGRWYDDAPDAGEAARLSTPAQISASRAAGGGLAAFYEAWSHAWVKRHAKARAA